MFFGRRIFADKLTGVILHDTGEVTTFVENYAEKRNEWESVKILQERDPESVVMLELEYGQYGRDFAEGILDHVDPETKQLYFRYPDPNEPGQEPEPRPPLSTEVEALKQENILLKAQNTALSERADFIEDVIAEMAQQVYQ